MLQNSRFGSTSSLKMDQMSVFKEGVSEIAAKFAEKIVIQW